MHSSICRGNLTQPNFLFFNDTAPTEIYTLSLHDALPILRWRTGSLPGRCGGGSGCSRACSSAWRARSEEHTSELQSQFHLVCRLLLEKKNEQQNPREEAMRMMTRRAVAESIRPRALASYP